MIELKDYQKRAVRQLKQKMIDRGDRGRVPVTRLQNKVWRMKLRDYIVEHKLTDDFWSGRMAAEGFGIIAAILLAA